MRSRDLILLSLLFLLLGLFLARAGLDWKALLHGPFAQRLESLKTFVAREGKWSDLAYLVLFATLPLALVPVSLLCVAAGLAFRPVEAGVLIWTGSLAC